MPEISVKEAGKLGGTRNFEKHGSDHMAKIGRLGGSRKKKKNVKRSGAVSK